MNIRALSYLIAFSIALGVAFVYLKAKDSEQPAKHDVVVAETPVVFKVSVIDGVLQSPPLRIQTTVATPVVLEVTIDHADEIHIHGIDLTYPLDAGKTNQITLISEKSGSFELELHEQPVTLGVLEVYPQ